MATTLSLLRFAPLPPRLTLSSLTINRTTSPMRSLRMRRVPPISASFTPVPAIDRLVSFLSYARLFLNSLSYSCFLQFRYALVASFISRFNPLLAAYTSAPYLEILGFIVLYFFLARNPAMSRHVRVNARHCVCLDALRIWLDLMLLPIPILFGTSPGQIGVAAFELAYGAIFVVGIVVSVYGMICSLAGHVPYVPIISSWAKDDM